MLLLHFLGEESGTNRGQPAVFWRSTGTAHNAHTRCVEAIQSLRGKCVNWPSAEEMKKIAAQISKDNQILNPVGTIDSTLLELAIMPEADDKADYSGRKFQ